MSHSVIPCSSADVWGKPGGCTGWASMVQLYPETEESPAAAEGTAAHEIASALVEAACTAEYLPAGHFVDQLASNGVMFTEEMFEAAELYADTIAAVMRESAIFAPPHLAIEQRVNVTRVHARSYGTPDCWLFDRKSGKLYVWDFKYGMGVVEVFEMWQLINYAAGIIELLGLNGLETQYIELHLSVVQPRAFHRDGPVRTWSLQASDLRPYVNQLHAAAHETLGPNGQLRTGDHCKHCSARHACPAALKAGVSLFEAAAAPVPIELSLESLGVQLTLIRRAKRQLTLLETGYGAQVEQLVRSGKNVPGWGVVATYGRQKWNQTADEVVAVGEMFNVDLRKPLSVVTPKQAITLGVDESVITAYSSTTQSGVKVVPDDGTKAKRVFT